MKKILTFLVLVIFPFASLSDDMAYFDFALIASQCKLAASYLNEPGNPVQALEGEPFFLICQKNKRDVDCVVGFEKSKNKSKASYQVLIDVPPTFVLRSENNADAIYIDTTKGFGSYQSRIFNENYLGSKVCSVRHFTYDEFTIYLEETKKD